MVILAKMFAIPQKFVVFSKETLNYVQKPLRKLNWFKDVITFYE